jgi:hypothetical protein
MQDALGSGHARERTRFVKRIGIGVGVVCLALVLAASAIAGSRGFTGTVDPAGTVSFTARTHAHRIVQVRQFIFAGVPATCDEGTAYGDISDVPLPAMEVNDRHRFRGAFRLTDAGQRMRVRVHGGFKHHGKRARGRLRLTGHFGQYHHCDTGRARWRAHRG